MTGQGTYYRRDGRLITATRQRVRSRVRQLDMVGLPSTRRRNACGITPEVPTPRSWAWNLALIGFEAGIAWWAHTAAGVSWSAIVATLAAVALSGVALMTYVIAVHTPRALRRHDALLQAHAAARSAQPAPVEVVDRQSTPHHRTVHAPPVAAVASVTSVVDPAASRAR